MDDRHRIGQVIKPGMNQADFAHINTPEAWIETSNTLARAARVIEKNLRDSERAMRMALQPARPTTSGTFVVSGSFMAGEGNPFEAMIRFIQDQYPMLMLAGMSIETALKALWVQRDPACVSKGKAPLSHHQVAVAGKAGVSLSDAEIVLCELLTDFVVFMGRYPSSAYASNAHNSTTIGDDVFTEFELLFARLHQLYIDRSTAVSESNAS